MTDAERLSIEVKLAGGDDVGTISGYASRFGGAPDSYGDTVAPGAFAQSLAEHKAAATTPLMLWHHDMSAPIGVWSEIREDAEGLAVKGRLILETERGREAHALLRAGAINGLSIGFRTRDASRRSGGGRVLENVELLEISLVSLPAASRARIDSVKSAAIPKGRSKVEDEDLKPANAGASEFETRAAALEEAVSGFDDRMTALEAEAKAARQSAERIEGKLRRPGAAPEAADPAKLEAKAFGGFLRHGREALPADEVKTLRVSEDTAGGYLAPEQFTAQVIKGIVEFSPMRQAARVGSTAAGSVLLPKRTGQPTAAWVDELEDRAATESNYGQLEIHVHEAACYVDVSQRLLEDAAVNIEAEIASDLAEEFGRLEGVAFVKGDGLKKPIGFMQNASIAETANGHAADLSADALITLLYGMKSAYRNRGAWMMNGATLATVRKLKDGQNNYLWQPSYQAGQPETILGRPVIEAVDMDDIAADAFPIAFGDFATAYRIYDRVALSVMRDPYSQATKGVIRFHARRRVGGDVVQPEALAKLKMAV